MGENEVEEENESKVNSDVEESRTTDTTEKGKDDDKEDMNPTANISEESNYENPNEITELINNDHHTEERNHNGVIQTKESQENCGGAKTETKQSKASISGCSSRIRRNPSCICIMWGLFLLISGIGIIYSQIPSKNLRTTTTLDTGTAIPTITTVQSSSTSVPTSTSTSAETNSSMQRISPTPLAQITCLKVKVGGTRQEGATEQVEVSYKDPDFRLMHFIPPLPMALERHASFYTAELGLLVCGGQDKRHFQQDACYTHKLSNTKWNKTSKLNVMRVNACVRRIGDSLQIRGGTNINNRCHKSMEVLDLKNPSQGFQLEDVDKTTECDDLLCHDQNEITIPCPP